MPCARAHHIAVDELIRRDAMIAHCGEQIESSPPVAREIARAQSMFIRGEVQLQPWPIASSKATSTACGRVARIGAMAAPCPHPPRALS